MQEEEAQARKAKKEEAAALEFEKWKGAFSVDAEGTTENELQDGSQDLLSNFVEYIKVLLSSVSKLVSHPNFVLDEYSNFVLQSSRSPLPSGLFSLTSK